MLNFLIVCSKTGTPLKTLGTMPKNYTDVDISNMAVMVNEYAKVFHEDKELIDKDFTIYLRKKEPPYAKTKDDSIIKLIEGEHVNVVFSGKNTFELTPVYEILKLNDSPTNALYKVNKRDIVEIMEDFTFTRVNLNK